MANELKQLFFAATGETHFDVDAFVAQVKEMKTAEEQMAAISRLMWRIPGGVANKGKEFKAALMDAVNGTLAVVDADLNEDEKIDEKDFELLDELFASTAQVVTDEEDDVLVEDEE